MIGTELCIFLINGRELFAEILQIEPLTLLEFQVLRKCISELFPKMLVKPVPHFFWDFIQAPKQLYQFTLFVADSEIIPSKTRINLTSLSKSLSRKTEPGMPRQRSSLFS